MMFVTMFMKHRHHDQSSVISFAKLAFCILAVPVIKFAMGAKTTRKVLTGFLSMARVCGPPYEIVD